MTNQPIRDQMDEADLIMHNAKVTTLQDNGSEADAFAVRGERFVAVGDEAEVMRLRGNRTRLIDVGGRRVIPGLNDSHLHAIRGGQFYNLELRWDGVQSLQRGLEMIRDQAKRTPKDQWGRVIGGWSPYQFKEKRMPTIAELNDAASDTPVFVLFAYSQVLLNKAGVAAVTLTPESKSAEGDHYEFVDGGAIIRGTAAVNATVLTVTGRDVAYSAPPFATFTPEQLPPVSPAWSPVAVFGGYQRAGVEKQA